MEDRRIWLDQIPVEDAADLLLSADTSPSDTQRLESSRQQRQQYTLERILKTHVVDWEAKYVEIARQCNDEARPSGGLFEAMPGFDFLEEEGGHRLREIMSTQSPIPTSDRQESGSASNKEKVGTQDALGKEMRLDAFSQLLGFESSRYMLEMAMPGQYKIPKELFDPPTGSEQQETKHPHITGETSNERTRETASTKTSERRHQMNITPHSTSTSSNKYPVPQTAIRSGRLASQLPIPPTKTDSSISAFNWQTPIIIPPQHKQPFKNDNPMPSSSRALVTTATPSAASTQDSVGGQRARKRRAKKRNKETSESQHPPPRRPPPPKSGPSVPPPSANENSIPQVLSSGNRARQAHPSIPRAAKSRKKRVPVVVPAPGTERPPAMSPSMPQVATGGNKKIPVVVPASGIARPPTASPSIPQVSPSGSRKPPEVVSTASVTSNNRPPGRRNWLTDHGALSIESVGSEGTQVVFRPNPTGNSMRKRLLGKPEEFDDAYYDTAAPEQSNSHKFIAKEDHCYVLFESGKKTVIGHVKDVHPLIQRYFLTKDSKSHDY